MEARSPAPPTAERAPASERDWVDAWDKHFRDNGGEAAEPKRGGLGAIRGAAGRVRDIARNAASSIRAPHLPRPSMPHLPRPDLRLPHLPHPKVDVAGAAGVVGGVLGNREKLGQMAVEGFKDWARNMMFWRKRDVLWWAGAATGTLETVTLFAYLGPAGGFAKSGINFAVSQGFYAGSLAARKWEERSIKKQGQREGLDEEEIGKRVEELNSGRYKASGDALRRFMAGVAAAGTYGSFTGLIGTAIEQATGFSLGGSVVPGWENKPAAIEHAKGVLTSKDSAYFAEATKHYQALAKPVVETYTDVILGTAGISLDNLDTARQKDFVSKVVESKLVEIVNGAYFQAADFAVNDNPSQPSASLATAQFQDLLKEQFETGDVARQLKGAVEKAAGDYQNLTSKPEFTSAVQAAVSARPEEVSKLVDNAIGLTVKDPGQLSAQAREAIRAALETELKNAAGRGFAKGAAEVISSSSADPAKVIARGNDIFNSSFNDPEAVKSYTAKAQTALNEYLKNNPADAASQAAEAAGLTDLDERLQNGISAEVGKQLGKVREVTDKVLQSRGINPVRLLSEQPEQYEKVRMAMQHQFERLANYSYSTLHVPAGGLQNAQDLADVLRSGEVDYNDRVAAISNLDPEVLIGGQAPASLPAYLSTDEINQAVSGAVKAAAEGGPAGPIAPSFADIAASVSKNAIPHVDIPSIPAGTHIGDLMVKNGYDLTNWSTPANIDALAVQGIVNHKLLDEFWQQMQAAGKIPVGEGYPIQTLADWQQIIREVKLGNPEAIKKFRLALMWIPAGGKFAIIKQAGVQAVLKQLT